MAIKVPSGVSQAGSTRKSNDACVAHFWLPIKTMILSIRRQTRRGRFRVADRAAGTGADRVLDTGVDRALGTGADRVLDPDANMVSVLDPDASMVSALDPDASMV